MPSDGFIIGLLGFVIMVVFSVVSLFVLVGNIIGGTIGGWIGAILGITGFVAWCYWAWKESNP